MKSVFRHVALWVVTLLTVAVVVACTYEEQPTDDTTRVPVAFAMHPATRAGSTYVSMGELGTGARIGVFAYHTHQLVFGTGTGFLPNFMLNQPVERASSGLWVYTPLKYWPNEKDEKVTFCGYYPHDGAGISYSIPAGGGLPEFSFEVQERSRDQVDFMLSDIRADEVHINDERTTPIEYKVRLRFRHMLTRVVIKVVDEDDEELPFVATISGLYDRGDHTQDGSAWANLAKTPKTLTTDGASTPDERVMLLLPQTLEDEARLRINYTYNGALYQSEEIQLNEVAPVTEWEPGLTYTYVYHVGHKSAAIGVTVNPWYQAGMVFNY